ncbi:MAG: DUF1848 domain-containing protein [Rhodospirillaceae bacterium]
MILSASYRTDIPAFHGAWFAQRLAAGFAVVANPYGGRPSRIDLTPRSGPQAKEGAVDGYVFWTRNAKPFLPVLDQLAGQGVPFVVQYTVLGYPSALDGSTPSADHAIAVIQELSNRYGRDSVVWRYDPVVFSQVTPAETHRQSVAQLARALKGAVNEVVFSVLQPYCKTTRNLAKTGIPWWDPEPKEKTALIAELGQLAAQEGDLTPSLCAQPDLLPPDFRDAACIDAERLSRVAGQLIPARRDPHRKTCRCAQSRDLGAYDSCAHGCVYCYANASPAAGQRGVAKATADTESLLPLPKKAPAKAAVHQGTLL